MADREKVVKALEMCSSFQCHLRRCPYWNGSLINSDCIMSMMKDALELLNGQETTNTGESRIFHCEKCGYGLFDVYLSDESKYDIEPNFCPNCGRRVIRNA